MRQIRIICGRLPCIGILLLLQLGSLELNLQKQTIRLPISEIKRFGRWKVAPIFPFIVKPILFK
jgi:hypothetical protein